MSNNPVGNASFRTRSTSTTANTEASLKAYRIKPCTNGPVHSFAPSPCCVVLGIRSIRTNLAGRHIQMLVDYWTGNARIADRCRQRGVAMLERPHSTPYIEQQLSFLRVYADTWIGEARHGASARGLRR